MSTVSYAGIKAAVPLRTVLERYGATPATLLPVEGSAQVRLHCPVCKYTQRKSLSVHLEKNLFRCFHDGCTQGNVLDFVAAMENVDLRAAGKLLTSWYMTGSPKKSRKKKKTQKGGKGDLSSEPVKNKPLSFALKKIDYQHASLRTLRLRNPALYGVGFYTGRGQHKDHIVFPLHNPLEQLLGYGTLSYNEETKKVVVGYPKAHQFCQDADLYCPLVREHFADTLVIVQNPYHAMHLHERGVDVVAFMAPVLGKQQLEHLAAYEGSYGAYRYSFPKQQADADKTLLLLQKALPEISAT